MNLKLKIVAIESYFSEWGHCTVFWDFLARGWLPQNFSDPFIRKKNVQIIGFIIFKSTGSISRFQRKNRFWKIRTESQGTTKKLSKIDIPNQTSKIWHIFSDISELGAYFSKPIFALTPWDWAGRFEYHEPYNPNDFFSTYKGVIEILRQSPPKLKNLKIQKVAFFLFLYTIEPWNMSSHN